ncbi:TlyA family RNA methyltransferase [Maricaulis sp. CAU 1757]
MRADLFLVEHGFFESRARAQEAIAAGKVRVDGTLVRKPSQKISAGSRIEAEAAHPWVSRAALKLVAALEAFPVDPRDRVCVDIGSSTGGFTEVLLSRGARHVYAVDVGRDQLHPSLQADRRVSSMEATDARSLTDKSFTTSPSFLVCDASFISLTKLLPPVLGLLAPKSDLIILVKPQFEAGRAAVGRGGLVKSEADRLRSLEKVRSALEAVPGLSVSGIMDSPIAGGDGNKEYLMSAALIRQ